MPRAPGSEDEVEGQDEEFVHHLARGSELLTRGEPAEALHSLQRAAALRPKDGKVLGLLGQACYRTGRFEEAAHAYGRLVDDNPTEVAARVNLGLANLKAGRHADAVKQFSIALDLNPDHRKAMGYLGLAQLDSGDPRAAREWFEKSGSTLMVARCDELIAAGPPSTAAGEPAEPAVATGAAAMDAAGTAEAGPEAVAGRPQGAAVEAIVPPPPEPQSEHGGEAKAEPHREPESQAAPASVVGLSGETGLGAFASRRTLRLAAESFAVEGRVLAVAVRRQTFARLDGLFAVRGEVALAPELKRFRGKPTDKPFGEGPERMHRATGEGTLLYRTGGRVFTAVDLGGDAGYFREEAVFALEDQVVFENGRVPAKQGRDLNLVHLRGRGKFLLRTVGEPLSLELTAAAPLRIPADALVGWTGALTPRMVPLAGEDGTPEAVEGASVVELTGDGRVLVDPDAPANE